MTKIYVTKLNESYLRITTDDMGVRQELSEYFSFQVPGYKFMPAFKNGMWDGILRLYGKNQQLYAGLYEYIEKFCERNEYEIEYIPTEKYPISLQIKNVLDKDKIEEWVHSLEHQSKGKQVTVYPHQIDGIYTALNEDRVTLESPTSSGKSLMIYSIIRWHLNFGRNVLLMVPTTQLCEQMYSDFDDYSSNGWTVEDHCQKLYSGFSKIIEKPVLISTWQSLIKQSPEYYKQFDVVITDEVHTAKGASISSILEKMTNTKYRVGLTGTLDDAKVNQLIITGLFGRVHKVITTRELMDTGKVVDLDIRAVILKHTEEDCKIVKGSTFQDEMAFLTEHSKRNKFIANLSISTTGNTLVLCNLVDKHLKPLAEMIKQKSKDSRQIYMIYGDIKPEDRESIRQELSNINNAIIVASYATMSTGVNIPSIENIILASSSKSKIRNLQSIGRGLRLMSGKTKCKLFDIADNLVWKKKENHTFKHFKERLDQYAKEEFNYKLIEVNL